MPYPPEHLRFTEQDLARFRSVGIPLPVFPKESSPEELVQSVKKALICPTARLSKAAATVILYLAHHRELDVFERPEDDSIRRRLGFLLDGLAAHVDAGLAKDLRTCADQMYMDSDKDGEPLYLMASMTPTLSAFLQEDSRPENQKWQVFGVVEIYDQACSEWDL